MVRVPPSRLVCPLPSAEDGTLMVYIGRTAHRRRLATFASTSSSMASGGIFFADECQLSRRPTPGGSNAAGHASLRRDTQNAGNSFRRSLGPSPRCPLRARASSNPPAPCPSSRPQRPPSSAALFGASPQASVSRQSGSTSVHKADTAAAASSPSAQRCSGLQVDPKFMTRQTFRSSKPVVMSKGANNQHQQQPPGQPLAAQLKEMGQHCSPVCSPRRLYARRQRRAQKRILPDLRAKARPTIALLHPPCTVSGAVVSCLAREYHMRYEENLRELYNKQLEREVNIDRTHQKVSPLCNASNDSPSKSRKTNKVPVTGAVTGKFSVRSFVQCHDDSGTGGFPKSILV